MDEFQGACAEAHVLDSETPCNESIRRTHSIERLRWQMPRVSTASNVLQIWFPHTSIVAA